MGDAVLFRKTMAIYGGMPKEPSDALLAFLDRRCVSKEAVDSLLGYLLSDSIVIGAVAIYGEEGWVGANDESYVPIALRDGLLIVGGCPNGDLVVVDVGDRLGSVGFVDHERMWSRQNVREACVVVTAGLGEFVAGIDAGELPDDYYAAKKAIAKAERPT